MISINQPYFLPNLGFFGLLQQCDYHVLLNCVAMRKKSWVTRNYFGSDNQLISVRVKDISQNRTIQKHYLYEAKTEIKSLKNKLLKVYKNSLFIEEIEQILSHFDFDFDEEITICKLNYKLYSAICEILKFKVNLKFSNGLGIDNDLLQHHRLAYICLRLGDRCYLNLEDGRKLYTQSLFDEYNIKLYFNKTTKLKAQVGDRYFYRSILDLIADYGVAYVESLLREKSMNNQELPFN